jgi:5-methyltetrahydrofolate--homocysteine methyltransferase
MALNIAFDGWERIERNWTAWWAGELARPLVVIEGVAAGSEAVVAAAPDFTSEFGLDTPVDAVLDCYERRLEATRYHGDAFPKWWPNFGPGIVAGFLGAEVHCAKDTVWFTPGADTEIAALQVAYDAGNPWWRRVRDLTAAAVERWGDRVAVAHTDLGGDLDVLASLRTTERLLYELTDAPDEVGRLARDISQLWQRYYDELSAIIQPAGRGTTPWAAIWSPAACYMLQCDFAYMLSPRMFRRFVLPTLAERCAGLDHAFYHLDGKGQLPHVDMLLGIDALRGIQWIPGDGAPPVEEWLPLLKRIRDAGKLCQLYASPEGALAIVKALGGKGFAFYIRQEMDAPQAADYLTALHHADRERA